jgi:hypothetical protein
MASSFEAREDKCFVVLVAFHPNKLFTTLNPDQSLEFVFLPDGGANNGLNY